MSFARKKPSQAHAAQCSSSLTHTACTSPKPLFSTTKPCNLSLEPETAILLLSQKRAMLGNQIAPNRKIPQTTHPGNISKATIRMRTPNPRRQNDELHLLRPPCLQNSAERQRRCQRGWPLLRNTKNPENWNSFQMLQHVKTLKIGIRKKT